MRITTKGRYALRALINLAATSQGKPKPIKAIAREEKISPEFLEQIFFKMKKAGLINSVRGPGGGFMLHRDPATITVKAIFLAVEEGLDLTPCTPCTLPESADPQDDSDPCSKTEQCIARSVWKTISDQILQYLETITLATILEENQEKLQALLEKSLQD
ncbi:transcriptional regulator, BadM/Rrf2 family [Alkalispirochaeta americana]|uniref:Transcriptional regulator, BadM/Rrf2 family n=1 Tax=Alkalispirochaeta americana TaxID=159291 RepID=A0A1N6N8E8_9SPIO|nr:Rrf2 family transcriptional regulator [Alkalispirochaeta americana]SIP88330.1 transcriptional regulator, BadM/Rrf2 family [Alkalispirochaeta americana]